MPLKVDSDWGSGLALRKKSDPPTAEFSHSEDGDEVYDKFYSTQRKLVSSKGPTMSKSISRCPASPVKSSLKQRSTSIPKKSKAVGFSEVRVHTHKTILGDNPSVSQGLPVTMDWDVQESCHFNLDDYEKETEGSRQQQWQKRMPAQSRKELLLQHGHSRESFLRVVEEIQEIKGSRQGSKNKSTVKRPKGQKSLSPKLPASPKRMMKRFFGKKKKSPTRKSMKSIPEL
jgi:hypothetical protein